MLDQIRGNLAIIWIRSDHLIKFSLHTGAINSVMTNGAARITRSTSRFLRERNMLNESGLLFKVKEDEFSDKKLNNKPSNEILAKSKKVSFDKEKQSDKIEEEQEELSDKPDEVEQSKSPSDKENEGKPVETGSAKSKKSLSGRKNRSTANDEANEVRKSSDLVATEPAQLDNQPAKPIDQLNISSQAMECSPARNASPAKIDPNLVTPKNNKQAPSNLDVEEWLTDDESSIKIQPNTFSNADSQAASTNSKPKSGLPGPRAGLKRSATVKSASKPMVDIKRNKTNEFATPQSIKKLSRPLNYGSANKKILRLPTATVTKSALAKPAVTLPKIVSQTNTPFETPSQVTASAGRYLLPPSTSASSGLSSSSQASLKSCPSTGQQTGKTLARNNSNNSDKQQRCFAESALKKRLEEEKRRNQLKQNIQAKEDDAEKKRALFLQERAKEAKTKRVERERKVQEGKLLQNAEAESKREQIKKQEELKKQAELQAEERMRKAAEQKRQEEEELAKKLEEQQRQAEEQKLKELEDQKRAEAMKKDEVKTKQNKKVEFDSEDLQTRVYEKLEKKVIEDEMKRKNTPIKQLVREAVGKTNAEKSLYKPEVDPSLDVIELSLSSSDSSMSATEDETTDIKETTSNCTFIKDIGNKALSSTFIKPAANAPTAGKAIAQPPENVESSVAESYDISDLRSDDEDEDETPTQHKKIPIWASGHDFMRAIKNQYSVGIRTRENTIKGLFSSIETNVSLKDVFREREKHVSKKYERRTSSACWSSPPLTYIDKSFSTFY